MGNCSPCCRRSLPRPLSPRPGQVVNLTAVQDASSASVTLQWVPPMHNGDLVTSYDVRFKPVGAGHYTYKTVDQPHQFSIMLSPTDGLTPLTRCNFEVRAKIHNVDGHWCGIIQYVEWSCRLPGCFNSRIRISRNHISAFCSRDHAKHCALEFCLFRECQERKSRVEGLEYHFCTPFHLRMAKLRNLSALLEMNGPTDQFKELCKVFRKKWAKGTCPAIHSVLQIVNPTVEERFNAYCQNLPWGNRKVEQFFHGTTLSCNILEHLLVCSESRPLEECGVCGIVENGFEENRISNRWQRFGPGFYLASKTSKAADYSRGRGSTCALFLCDVAPGKKYELRINNPGLNAPPPGHHSVHGKSKFLGAIDSTQFDFYLHQVENMLKINNIMEKMV